MLSNEVEVQSETESGQTGNTSGYIFDEEERSKFIRMRSFLVVS